MESKLQIALIAVRDSINELLTVLSENKQEIPQAKKHDPEIYEFGNIVVDVLARCVYRSKKEIVLENKNFELLVYLLRHENVACSRDTLLADIWDIKYDYTRTVDSAIYKIRRLIERDSSNPEYIHTVNGYGYKFRLPVIRNKRTTVKKGRKQNDK